MANDLPKSAEKATEVGQANGPDAGRTEAVQRERSQTFGQLVADIARTTVLVERTRAALAAAESNLTRLPGEVGALREQLTAAQADATAAVNALDAALGFGPQDLEGISKTLAELPTLAEVEHDALLRQANGVPH
jgi:DNA-binding PucR family transcriptional regulator